jgi:hypothetical protein
MEQNWSFLTAGIEGGEGDLAQRHNLNEFSLLSSDDRVIECDSQIRKENRMPQKGSTKWEFLATLSELFSLPISRAFSNFLNVNS